MFRISIVHLQAVKVLKWMSGLHLLVTCQGSRYRAMIDFNSVHFKTSIKKTAAQIDFFTYRIVWCLQIGACKPRTLSVLVDALRRSNRLHPSILLLDKAWKNWHMYNFCEPLYIKEVREVARKPLFHQSPKCIKLMSWFINQQIFWLEPWWNSV